MRNPEVAKRLPDDSARAEDLGQSRFGCRSAAAVFETLNDRGIGLSTSDLLKNFLLLRAKNDSERSDIEGKGTRSLSLSKSLAKSADDYELLIAADVPNRDLRLPLEAVQALNAKVLMPALLSARAVGNQSQQAELAQLLVAVFVRHTLIGGLAAASWRTSPSTSPSGSAKRKTSMPP